MISKKNPKLDLEQHRGLFFLIGLALTLGILVYALQYKTPNAQAKAPDPAPADEAAMVNIDMPITVREKPDLPEKSKTDYTKKPEPKPEPRKEDEPKDEPRKKLNTSLGSHIGSEPDDDIYNPEPLAPVFLEKIARPAQCDKFETHTEQLSCLNDWIKRYIQSHVQYPEIPKAMGVEERIFVEIVFSELGDVESTTVIRGENPHLKREALRVIEGIPAFVPASQQGRPVRMKMTVPVNFKLN